MDASSPLPAGGASIAAVDSQHDQQDSIAGAGQAASVSTAAAGNKISGADVIGDLADLENEAKDEEGGDEEKALGIMGAELMATIEQQAEAAAIMELKDLFYNSAQLNRLEQYQEEYTRKHRRYQAQLSAAVRTQVDEMCVGVERIHKSVDEAGALKQAFYAMNAECTRVKEPFSNYPAIQKLNKSFINVNSSLRLIEDFERIPQRCTELLELLEEDEDSIKHVYKELRKLVRLRDKAYQEGLGLSDGFKDKIRECFESINHVVEDLQILLWENISDWAVLWEDNPTLIIRSVEVIEMEDRATLKVLRPREDDEFGPAASMGPDTRMRQKCFEELDKLIAQNWSELLRDEATHKRIQAEHQAKRDAALKAKVKAAEQRAREEKRKQQAAAGLASIDEDGEGEDDDEEDKEDDDQDEDEEEEEEKGMTQSHSIDELDDEAGKTSNEYIRVNILEEMSQLVTDTQVVKDCLVPLFPADYNLLDFYSKRHRKWTRLVLDIHTSDLGKLSKMSMLDIVKWLQNYMEDFEGSVTVADAVHFNKLVQDLMEEFTRSSQGQLMTLVTNILRLDQSEDCEPTAIPGSEHLTTPAPQELFSVVNSALEIVHEAGVKGRALFYIGLMFADVFAHFQDSQSRFVTTVRLDDEGEDFLFGAAGVRQDDTYICAVVNNCYLCEQHLEEMCDDLVEKIGEGGGAEDDQLAEQMAETFQDVEQGFVGVAEESVDILVMMVMHTTRQASDKLFTREWLSGDDVTDSITATLVDFFDEYKAAIARAAYFGLIVRRCLTELVAEYIRKLVRHRPPPSDQLTERMRKDAGEFKQCFSRYSGQVLRQEHVDEGVRGIEVVADFMEAELDFLVVHYAKIVEQFKEKALGIMKELLACRPGLSGEQRRDQLRAFEAELPQEYFPRQNAAEAGGDYKDKDDTAGYLAPLSAKKKRRQQESAAGGSGGGAGSGSGSGSGGAKKRGMRFLDAFKAKVRETQQGLQARAARARAGSNMGGGGGGEPADEEMDMDDFLS